MKIDYHFLKLIFSTYKGCPSNQLTLFSILGASPPGPKPLFFYCIGVLTPKKNVFKPLYDQDIFPEKQSKIGPAVVTLTSDSGKQTSFYFVLYPEIQFLAFS